MRNPKWEKEELILALDLYFRLDFGDNRSKINQLNEEVKKLSIILNLLPIHKNRPNKEVFRNPNGVYMKLNNFLRFDPNYPGKGLQRGGKLEEVVWSEYAYNTNYLKQEAKKIIDAVESSLDSTIGNLEEESEFPEGKVLYRLHKLRERNSSLIKKLNK